ncbi:MAG: LysM peptidoglycan-binding domain-containing protein [Firmicutes bacterium]|nr:LysM peptidoglycan-binding domain-containing protein [Bacillota bacterium]
MFLPKIMPQNRRLGRMGDLLRRRMSLFVFCLLLCLAVPCMANHPVLREGSTGTYVYLLQHYLHLLQYSDGIPDGILGAETRKAVQAFQKDSGLHPDGIVGGQTWQLLETRVRASGGGETKYVIRPGDTLWTIARRFSVGMNVLARVNNIKDPSLIQPGQELSIPGDGHKEARVELIPWSEIDKLFPNFSVAVLTDVETGSKFRVRRYYGHYHADVEPLTKEDVAVLREIYGGSWSWERRSVIVEIDGRRIAGSINGNPHGGASIRDNGFPGHICLHFLGSKLHNSHKVDERHHNRVLQAVGYEVE